MEPIVLIIFLALVSGFAGGVALIRWPLPKHDRPIDTPTESRQRGYLLVNAPCPDCGTAAGWRVEQSGDDTSTNYFCAGCGQGFNITNMLGEFHVERIHKDVMIADRAATAPHQSD